MILLCQSSKERTAQAADAGRFLGDFVAPRDFRHWGTTPTWAADNDAFNGFDADRFRRMLDGFTRASSAPVFVALPDVVGNHQKTLDLFFPWHRELAARNLNRAFVLQDGCPDWKNIPWEYCEALFIGGSTEFKLSPFAAYCAALARRDGKWVHMGRVNSVRRMRYAAAIGCNSCDGSGIARFPEKLRRMVAALKVDEITQARQLTFL